MKTRVGLKYFMNDCSYISSTEIDINRYEITKPGALDL